MPNEKDNNESIQQELHATRKVGLPRYFEMVGRDLWAFYRAGFLCAVGFLPGAVLLWFGLMGGAALYSLLGGLLAGLVGAPFVSGMIDTVLRSLRDEPGYWWHTYRRAWKQNWRQSLVPGALLGLFLGGWGWLLRTMLDGRFAANPSATLWVVAAAGPAAGAAGKECRADVFRLFPAHAGSGAAAAGVLGADPFVHAVYHPGFAAVQLLAAGQRSGDDPVPGPGQSL